MTKMKFPDQILKNKSLKHFLLVLFFFFALFYALFPAFISKSVGKPITFIDWFPTGFHGVDYLATYVASKSLLDGHNIYLNNASLGDEYKDPFAGGGDSRYSYPPLQAFLLAPLSIFSSTFSYENSYFVWSIISKILILVSIFLISRLVKYKKTAFVFLTVFYGLSSFFWFHIERGQTDSLLLFFMSLSIYLYLEKRKIAWSALFFSLAILLKVFPLIFIPFFILRKEYKFLIYTLIFSLTITFITGFDYWLYWLFSVLPNYKNYYLGYEVEHSLAYLTSGFLDKPFPQIVKIAQIFSALLMLLYMIISYLSKNKSRNLILIELAIISIIAEISAPWSANYKLVTLILLFVTPFLILEIKTIKNRVLLTIPLLFSFIFLSPIYNEFYGRFLFSFISRFMPGEFIIYQPIQKLAEFRVSLSLLFCLFYLFSLQVYLFLKDKNFFSRAITLIRVNKVKVAAVISILFLVAGSLLTYSKFKEYQKLKANYLEEIGSYGKEDMISDAISLVGYNIDKNSSGSYDVELIIKVNNEINRHFAFFIHGYSLDRSSTEGINFFPYVLVPFWPSGKYVVIRKTVNFTAKPQDVTFGLFDLSNGLTYGGEMSLGVINLNELK